MERIDLLEKSASTSIDSELGYVFPGYREFHLRLSLFGSRHRNPDDPDGWLNRGRRGSVVDRDDCRWVGYRGRRVGSKDKSGSERSTSFDRPRDRIRERRSLFPYGTAESISVELIDPATSTRIKAIAKTILCAIAGDWVETGQALAKTMSQGIVQIKVISEHQPFVFHFTLNAARRIAAVVANTCDHAIIQEQH